MSDKELTGRIEDVFGHRFTLATDEGKLLVDVGPRQEAMVAAAAGQTVTVDGERKGCEVKARRIRLGDGEWQAIERPEQPKGHKGEDAKHPPHHDDEPVEIAPDAIERALREHGYDNAGEPVRKPRHVEVEADKDGVRHTVHIHAGGEVKKAEPVAQPA